MEYGKSHSWYAFGLQKTIGTFTTGKSAATTPMTTPGPGSYGSIAGAHKPGPKWR